jgi:hypothetical protein
MQPFCAEAKLTSTEMNATTTSSCNRMLNPHVRATAKMRVLAGASGCRSKDDQLFLSLIVATSRLLRGEPFEVVMLRG